MKKGSDDPRLYALTTLLNLEQRLRWAKRVEARFIAVNESKELVDFTQSVLWEAENNQIEKGAVTAISNTAVVDKNAPFVLFIKDLIKDVSKNGDLSQAQIIQKETLQNQEVQKDWEEWFQDKILWIPLKSENVPWQGGLIFSRRQPWTEGEQNLIEKFSDSVTYMLSKYSAQDKLNIKQYLKNKKKTNLIFAALCLFLLIPFKTSVLAPAEVIAQKPSLVRAPLDGIVETIHVRPNQKVIKGDVLITFDQAELTARMDVAENAVKVAQTELRQISQEAMDDRAAMSRIAAAQGRLEKERAEVSYIKQLLKRTQIKASADGVVVFEDAYDWLGRPVAQGERIMLLADPAKTELEIQLNIHDKITLPQKADIRFFSNSSPHKPNEAILNYVSYRATKTPDDVMAYRLKGSWNNRGDNLRLGQKGTAKIYGHRRPLIWQILRVPFTKLRQWTGL